MCAQTLVEPAPAKINLTLEVVGRRADGYHELASLVAFADANAADELTCEPSEPYSVGMRGPFAQGVSGRNLIETTVAIAREHAAHLAVGRIEVLKQIPVAAGLGGGSADAGAVLRLLRRLNPDATVDWTSLAKRIGADVPVCFHNQPCFMTGIGDTLHPIGPLPGLPAVLVNPMVAVPADKTAQVFRALQAPPLRADQAPPLSPPPFEGPDAVLDYMAHHPNHLEPAARTIVAAIDDVMAALKVTEGCRIARLSGGGPTCFGVYATAGEARSAAAAIKREHPAWWTRATTLS